MDDYVPHPAKVQLGLLFMEFFPESTIDDAKELLLQALEDAKREERKKATEKIKAMRAQYALREEIKQRLLEEQKLAEEKAKYEVQARRGYRVVHPEDEDGEEEAAVDSQAGDADGVQQASIISRMESQYLELETD